MTTFGYSNSSYGPIADLLADFRPSPGDFEHLPADFDGLPADLERP